MIAFSDTISDPGTVTLLCVSAFFFGEKIPKKMREVKRRREMSEYGQSINATNKQSISDSFLFLLLLEYVNILHIILYVLIEFGYTNVTRIAMFGSWRTKDIACGTISVPQGSTQGYIFGDRSLLRATNRWKDTRIHYGTNPQRDETEYTQSGTPPKHHRWYRKIVDRWIK